ncbi:glycosyltransferase family 4 protein [Egicoccus sp. AB-alg2]|uniref:glycosyltransferase family 4 protein n=1 Tax=Egicoccus sp. AB-alg2 TaxID=3242693 RepID=UPI00359DBD32
MSAFSRVTALWPGDAGGWLSLARAHNRCGRKDDAATAALRSWGLQQDAVTLDLLCLVMLQSQRRDELLALLEGLDLPSCDTELLRSVANAAAALDHDELIARTLAELRTRGHAMAELAELEARVLFAAGDVEGADACIEQAGTGLDTRIRFYCTTGRAKHAGSLVPAGCADPALLLFVGLALSRQGWLRDAVDVLDRALVVDPGNAACARARERTAGELAALAGSFARPRLERRTAATGGVKGRVLHIVGKSLPYALAGYSVRTHNIVRAQRRAGLDPVAVTQFGFPVEGASGDVDTIDGIAYHRLTGDGTQPLHPAERLTRTLESIVPLVESLRPSVLHAASDYLNATVALQLGELFDLPVVYEARGFWEETWLSKQPFPDQAQGAERYLERQRAERRCLQQAHAVVTLAEVMAEHLRGVVPRDRIRVVPNAVDPDEFTPEPPSPALRAGLGLPPDAVVVGYVSSLVGYEGVDTLIDALIELRHQGVPVRGLIVGDGQERGELANRIAAAGAETDVVMTGRVPHEAVRGYYDLIDVFVVPRRDDRVCRLVTPLKPFEAMAMQKAVVVSDLPALRETVPAEIGRHFEAENPTDLAKVLGSLVEQPEERREMGLAGRRWVVENRTWDHMAERYLDLYRHLGAA